MSLLLSNPLPLLTSFSSTSRFSAATLPPTAIRPKRNIEFLGIRLLNPTNQNGAVKPLRASSTDIADSDGNGEQSTSRQRKEGKDNVVAAEGKLPPLESKLEERMEQKMRMKMAKKIRLRRKRLLRKRMLRKKGRWPPSKMKKLKNV